MHHPNTKEQIRSCLSAIEQKLDWGSPARWQNRDFEHLSDQIFRETGVRLSHTTLKRVWGRVRYTASPSMATLDTLARFAGYPHWRDFTCRFSADPHSRKNEPPTDVRPAAGKLSALRWPAALLGLTGIGFLFIFGLGKTPAPLVYSDIAFSSDPLTQGLPNTVVFHYDAAHSNADSVFIQQSWNDRLRFRVDKNGHTYASTYYYPGYFRAKLVLNDSIVREHDLYIRSGGWLGTVERDGLPLYYPESVLETREGIAFSAHQLAEAGFDTLLSAPRTGLNYVEDLGELSALDFAFDTEFRSDFSRGDGVCQFVHVLIRCSKGVYIIPFSIPGCVGELGLILDEREIGGRTHDLSGFGVDFSDWVHLQLKVRDGRVIAVVNGKPAYTADLTSDPGKVVGVTYRFQGAYAVHSARFQSGDSAVSVDLIPVN
ncbi:MAG: hypothetical protein H6562_19995 [Lewinellaceae bacterium]|nr:hypothetical protein [Lewinellaceae bacterium]